MDLVDRIAEALARSTSRREPIKALAATAFGLTAAWAAEGPASANDIAKRCTHITQTYQACNAPHNRLCTDTSPAMGGDPKNCNGSSCANGCTTDAEYYPGSPHTACWCTAVTGTGPSRYYYRCCDCRCPNVVSITNDDDGKNPLGCGCRERVFVNPNADANHPTHRHRPGG